MTEELPFIPTDSDYDKVVKVIALNKEYWKYWCIGYFNLKEKRGDKK
jgi:hypothetical protein